MSINESTKKPDNIFEMGALLDALMEIRSVQLKIKNTHKDVDKLLDKAAINIRTKLVGEIEKL